MVDHCMINGQRCSKCCQVLTIREHGNFREWRRYARWFPNAEGVDELHRMVRKISRRRAKKINLELVAMVKGHQSYFVCKHYNNGCTNYENRPRICSEYPYYGKTREEWLAHNKEHDLKPLYTDDCTFYIEVK